MELTNEIYEQVKELCAAGDNSAEEGLFDDAVEKYLEALSLIPEPKSEWEASGWIYAALGEAYFFQEDFEGAKNYLYDAMNCPDGMENPFINLLLGEALFELGNMERAKDYLLRAYMLEGKELFADEDEKYFALIADLTE